MKKVSFYIPPGLLLGVAAPRSMDITVMVCEHIPDWNKYGVGSTDRYPARAKVYYAYHLASKELKGLQVNLTIQEAPK